MKSKLTISPARTAEIFVESVDVRRLYCGDGDYFKVSNFWDDICEEGDGWKVKTYEKSGLKPHERKAGVVALGNMATLVVDEELVKNADRGCLFSNFTLAHEVGHLILDHHKEDHVVKNFQVFETETGLANIPPTVEELEANFAAVFFQCGIALLDLSADSLRLARRAFTDPYYVRKAQKLLATTNVRNELGKPKPSREKLVL